MPSVASCPVPPSGSNTRSSRSKGARFPRNPRTAPSARTTTRCIPPAAETLAQLPRGRYPVRPATPDRPRSPARRPSQAGRGPRPTPPQHSACRRSGAGRARFSPHPVRHPGKARLADSGHRQTAPPSRRSPPSPASNRPQYGPATPSASSSTTSPSSGPGKRHPAAQWCRDTTGFLGLGPKAP